MNDCSGKGLCLKNEESMVSECSCVPAYSGKDCSKRVMIVEKDKLPGYRFKENNDK